MDENVGWLWIKEWNDNDDVKVISKKDSDDSYFYKNLEV